MKVINGRMNLNNGEIITDNSKDYDIVHLETNTGIVIHKDKKLKDVLTEIETNTDELQLGIKTINNNLTTLTQDIKLNLSKLDNKFSKINLVQFAELNNIDTTLWDIALIQAIDYCILNKKTLYIPNGDYLLNGNIEIRKEGTQALIIEGENKTNTILRFKNDGIKFDNLEDTIDYQKRITFVELKNLTIRKQTIDKIGTGLDIKHFGYFKLDNVKIRDFEKGLSLYNGSEFDMITSEVLGNRIGIYLENPIKVGKQSDLANINIYSTRIYSNDNNIIANNCREINFIGCALMNYNGAIELNGITNIVNFTNCDFENTATTNDLIINSSGIINITDCSMNNPYSEKIILNSNCTLNLKGTLIQGTVLKTIIINDGFTPTITNDKIYIGYYAKGNTEFLNYPKPTLINPQNGDFKTGTVLPFSCNKVYTVSEKCITNEYSICFDRNGSDDIQINLNLDTFTEKVSPSYVEMICADLPIKNPLIVRFNDETQGYNFQVGGADGTLQQFTKDGLTWSKLVFKLPIEKGNKKISILQFLIPKSTTSSLCYIDTIRVYGDGQLTKLYSNTKPTVGKWNKGDEIYIKEVGKMNSNISSSYVSHYVCTSNSSDVNSSSTFKSATINLV